MRALRNYLLICLLGVLTIPLWAQEYHLLVGTYTTGKSEGIYVFRFNSQTGDFRPIGVTKGIQNPSFLAVAPNERLVYSVGELPDGGAVNTLSFDPKTGLLKRLGEISTFGNGPCHIAVDKTGKWVYVGHYGSGSISVFTIGERGILGLPTQTIKHSGKSINPQRQEKPHVHSINIAPNNVDVFVPDLGTDQIVIYRINPLTGLLSPDTPDDRIHLVKTNPGSGPRHFTIHPNGKFAYVIQELDGTVTVFDYQKGTLKAKQTISTLPPDYTGGRSCADIHVSPDGKFLYGSNRIHDSLVIYAIDPQTGTLSYIANEPVLGRKPRNFMIDPSGRFVLVANQDSDNITIFRRDAQTGLLQPTGQNIQVPTPVCLKMIPLR